MSIIYINLSSNLNKIDWEIKRDKILHSVILKTEINQIEQVERTTLVRGLFGINMAQVVQFIPFPCCHKVTKRAVAKIINNEGRNRTSLEQPFNSGVSMQFVRRIKR